MKAPIFSAYARTPKNMLAVVRVLEEDAYQNEPLSEDEKRFPALFAYARNPFEIRVVYDEQPGDEAPNDEPEYDPNACPHCGGAGVSHDQPDGCSGCNGSGQRRKGYWNNYGRDWDDSGD